jgi:hypothetical protein
MKDFFVHIFTDALGRPEIKMVLGIPAIIAGLVTGVLGFCGVFAMAWTGWSIYMGFCLGLVTATAVADAKIDAGV